MTARVRRLTSSDHQQCMVYPTVEYCSAARHPCCLLQVGLEIGQLWRSLLSRFQLHLHRPARIDGFDRIHGNLLVLDDQDAAECHPHLCKRSSGSLLITH
jgi:hypothetical protein